MPNQFSIFYSFNQNGTAIPEVKALDPQKILQELENAVSQMESRKYETEAMGYTPAVTYANELATRLSNNETTIDPNIVSDLISRAITAKENSHLKSYPSSLNKSMSTVKVYIASSAKGKQPPSKSI